MGTGAPFYKSVARLTYVSTFAHFFRIEVCTKVGDCLYLCFEVLIMVREVRKVEASSVGQQRCFHHDAYKK